MTLLAQNIMPAEMVIPAEGLMTAQSILSGVDAAPMSQLPPVWQDIADGKADISHPDTELLAALAVLFYTKATDKSPEVFQEGFDFQAFYSKAATDTLDYFGTDFLNASYLDFDAATAATKAPEAAKVVAFAKAVYDDFGTYLPASFYKTMLCPIERDSIYESRALFFHPDSQDVKRAYDSNLHALNVTGVLMRIQHHASREGFLVHHGCGCDSHLTQVLPGQARIDFSFDSDAARQKALIAFIWRLWNEYALFPLGVHSETLAL